MIDRGRALIGLILILVGIVFLLDATDVFQVGDIIRDWWPVILIGIGLIALLFRPRSWFGGGMLIIIGAVLLLSTLDLIDVPVWQLAIPVILIGIGVNLVLRGLGRVGTTDTSNVVNIVAVLGDRRITSEAMAFKRANVTSVLGEATLDLRNARLDSQGATVDTVSVLSEMSIVVPRGWRITVNGMPILGDFDDDTDHSMDLPSDSPELAVTGVSILGDVKVKHSR